MHSLASKCAPALAAALLFALVGCSSKGLVIDPPMIPPGAAGAPVRIGEVSDARAFTSQSFAAPVPSTRGDVDDPAWTGRVFGRRRATARTLGGDLFTLDPAGIPALVRTALAAGLARADHPSLAADAAEHADAPRIDAVIEVFWIREAMQSSAARLLYHAEVVVTGELEGFTEPIRLRAHGSMLSGAADGVLWRRAAARALDELAQAMADAVASEATDDTLKSRTAQ